MARDKYKARQEGSYRTQNQYDEESGARDDWARGYNSGSRFDQESGWAERSAR